jgi:hypothetical protein
MAEAPSLRSTANVLQIGERLVEAPSRELTRVAFASELQAQLGLAESGARRGKTRDGGAARREREAALTPRLSEADRAAHREFVASLGEKALWRDYL